jgi:hypothetical protein
MPGTATNDDAARAAAHETDVREAVRAGQIARGELFSIILFAIAYISTATAPAWFGPAIRNALDQALAPLKRTVAKVNFFISSHIVLASFFHSSTTICNAMMALCIPLRLFPFLMILSPLDHQCVFMLLFAISINN